VGVAGPGLLAAAIVWRSVSRESPSDSDTFSLTRPIGQAALWAGKVLFFVVCVAIPYTVFLSLEWRGFSLGLIQWIAMLGSVLLGIGLLGALAASITALASSSRQVIAIAIIALVAIGVWLAVLGPWMSGNGNNHSAALCGSVVGCLIAFAGLAAASWIATVLRRRLIALAAMLMTILAGASVAELWSLDWMARPERPYHASERLTLRPGAYDREAERPGRRLWSTLWIVGLGRDEVATVLEFAPISEGESWPPEGSHTDFPNPDRNGHSWIHSEHTRALFKHYPKDTLWDDRIQNSEMYRGRKAISEILTPLRLSREEAIAVPWRLRLVVHEMIQLEKRPFRRLWTEEMTIPIRPGKRLELEKFGARHDAYEMDGHLREVSSAIWPLRPYQSVRARGHENVDDFFLVLHDTKLSETVAEHLTPDGYVSNLSASVIPGGEWRRSDSRRANLRIWHPPHQQAFLKRPLDEWIDEQEASIWHAVESGIVEFVLTPEQMAEVITPPEEG
ncbi:MAG: hypothetical protein AAF236_16180, partial [Verrucomicrobiota bacterium]